MRIAFIDPQGLNRGLNVGLGFLAASIKRYGHEVKVFDLNNGYLNTKNRIREAFSYDAVGFSIKSFTLGSVYRILNSTERKDIICGGPHVSLDGYNLLKERPNFNIGVISEGEETLVELLGAIERRSALDGVKGIVFRRGNNRDEVVVSEPRELIPDIDSLPLPDYDVFDSVNKIIFDYPLVTSRGCPYSCIYCCVGKISGKKVRFRAIEKVIEEIDLARSKYSSRSFHILDDNFTLDIERAKNFCRGLISSGMDMEWSCPNGLRSDRIDEELVSLMRDSRCKYASIGIESLDEEVFAGIKKGESQKDIINSIALFNKYKIKLNAFFLIGLPKDSLQKNISSLKKAKQIGLHFGHWSLLVPYPGTETWKWIHDNARIISNWKDGFHFGPKPKVTFETDQFSAKEMERVYKIANILSLIHI